jgi:hypothetical protein
MNREYIEDLSGNVACITPMQAALPAPKRIEHVPYYYCKFCQSTFDIDYPQIDVSPNDGRARCPYDHKRLERLTTTIEVG